jgi:hypothetical protein
MANFQVVGIRRANPQDSHDEITHVCYYESIYQPRVIIPIDDVIRRIDANNKEFYLKTTINTLYLEVVRLVGQRPFIQTKSRFKKGDHLLGLQPC